MRGDRERLFDIREAITRIERYAARGREAFADLVHHYFGIDEGRVWSVVEKDLPAFKRSIERMLSELDAQ